uniref:Uncharacterized protein n=1 Tax=Strigamia maritima TaxID=126957 RepID=T1JKK5_STRMM
MVQKLTSNNVRNPSETTITDVFDSVSLDYPSNSNSNVYTIQTSEIERDEKSFASLDDDKSCSSVDTFPASRRTPTPTSDIAKREAFKRFLTVNLSCTYAIFLFMLGTVVYVTDLFQQDSTVDDVFNVFLTVVGLAWIAFFHFDLRRMVNRSKKKNPGQQDYQFTSQYCFKTGRHSGSFYLKIGAAAFCFGHLIHEGLLLSRQIIYLTSNEDFYRLTCFRLFTIITDIIHPIFSFYQLFIIFKYSNVVINRFREVARFALMHIIATNLCFWVHTIIRETSESIQEKVDGLNETHLVGPLSDIKFIRDILQYLTDADDKCVSKEVLSHFTVEANPYLYPFTIEYSLLLVGVWFVIWNSVGTEVSALQIAHMPHRTSNTSDENENYKSNLVIHVDCHSANRGLFAGLLVLLVTVISVIIFFVSIMNSEYIDTGVLINNVSDVVLHVIMLLAVILAYRQTIKLDINLHAVSFLDDTLLLIALPCFFLYGIFNMMAGIHVYNIFSILSGVLSIVQVSLQTPFIIDGLRRCSNTRTLRYAKPGRELITFLIVCNLAVWVLETFEIKSFQAHMDMFNFYGTFLWTILSHITLPLTLFYRFHSSVCLVDIWKSAYERGD